jgi:hypothetical protein
MLLQKNIIKDLFFIIENYHNKLYWIIFLESISSINILGSGASEYEIYFTYIHLS